MEGRRSVMGHRITRAASHLPVDEVKERMNTEARPWVRQHWWIIYNALVAPRKADEIALHTGVSATTVHRVISTYNRLGPTAVETPGKGGRRHEYLTLEEEQQFLAAFFSRAEAGEIATTAEIWRAFETRVGHPVDDITIYHSLDPPAYPTLMPPPTLPTPVPHS